MKRKNLLTIVICIVVLCLVITIPRCQKNREIESVAHTTEDVSDQINDTEKSMLKTAVSKKTDISKSTDLPYEFDSSTNEDTELREMDDDSNPNEKVFSANASKSSDNISASKNHQTSVMGTEKATTSTNNTSMNTSKATGSGSSSSASANTSNDSEDSSKPSGTISPSESINSNEISSSAPAITTTPTPTPEHTHTWVDIITYVAHPEETITETIVVQEAWSQEIPVYKNICTSICNACGADITGNEDAHIKAHMLNGENGSWRDSLTTVQIGTTIIEHPAVTKEVTVTVKESWTETVVTGQECSGCGAIR